MCAPCVLVQLPCMAINNAEDEKVLNKEGVNQILDSSWKPLFAIVPVLTFWECFWFHEAVHWLPVNPFTLDFFSSKKWRNALSLTKFLPRFQHFTLSFCYQTFSLNRLTVTKVSGICKYVTKRPSFLTEGAQWWQNKEHVPKLPGQDNVSALFFMHNNCSICFH